MIKNYHNYVSTEIQSRINNSTNNTLKTKNYLQKFKYHRDAISFIYRFTFLRIKGKTFKDDLRFLYYDLALNLIFNRITKFKINSFFHNLFIFRPKNRLKKIYHKLTRNVNDLLLNK